MKVLNIAGIGLLCGAIFLGTKPTEVSASVFPPTIITKNITASITNNITLQYTTNFASSSSWQTIGSFSSSTTVSFTNAPMVLIRGVCTNISASATLAWGASSDPSVSGYKLYYGVASRTYTSVIDVGASTTATVSNLTPGTTYYFAVTAYDSSGLESAFSNEASGAFQPTFALAIGN